MISKRFDNLGSDGADARLGLMGGTFDPIHIGHLRVAEEMRLTLGLDAVLFIPTGNPVFKKDQKVTDARVRLEMCRRAVMGNPHFDVSDIEVKREGYTFTVDTLRTLRAHYPDNVKLFFIVGSDTASTVGKWRDVAEVAQLASLAVAAGRPGSAQADELHRSVLEAAPFDLHIVQVSPLKVSSSELREALRNASPCRYLIPEPIRSFIREHGLYVDEGCRFASCPGSGSPCDDGVEAGAPHGVRAFCVSPGPVLTRPGMANLPTLVGRAADPAEIVDFALYLASDKGAFVDGTNHVIDGGRLSLPR